MVPGVGASPTGPRRNAPGTVGAGPSPRVGQALKLCSPWLESQPSAPHSRVMGSASQTTRPLGPGALQAGSRGCGRAYRTLLPTARVSPAVRVNTDAGAPKGVVRPGPQKGGQPVSVWRSWYCEAGGLGGWGGLWGLAEAPGSHDGLSLGDRPLGGASVWGWQPVGTGGDLWMWQGVGRLWGSRLGGMG